MKTINRYNVMLMGILGLTIFARAAFSAEVKKNTTPAVPVIRPVIGIVDDRKLASVREDYPELANKVLPQIAADNKLKIVIRKTAVMWIAPATQTLDITDLVLARLKSLVPSRTSTLPANPTVSTDAQLSQTQRSSANQALKSLRKLEAATEVGLTSSTYSERLIDTKADVQENLRVLPESLLKKEISLSLEAYIDARTAWDTFIEIPYYEVAINSLKRAKLVDKYSIPKHLQYAGDDGLKKVDKFNTGQVLGYIWQAASEHLSKAEALLK